MTPELGHFALILALCVALVQAALPLTGAARGNHSWIAVARPAAILQCLLLLLAFLALMQAFVANDFSVAYVASNSNSKLPLIYRISAVWGAHEGSLLLWALILGIWSAAVSLFSRSLPDPFIARVLGVMGLISVGFLLFMLLTSNPFVRLNPAPLDGADLNPLLQDPGLIIHPPMLYLGYVGFSVAFGFAIAALLGGRLDLAWARWARPWTLVAWVFLTVGIALGSWWAYYELGWGGWWFWDPVENASFMPWLIGTALIHSLAATEKRGVFKSWTVLLAVCAFSLSLLGTFLVRSGVLTSVHAFATDPARGVFILAFLVLVIGGSLALYAWRAPRVMDGSSFTPVSRESFLLLNSILLTVAMAAILLGTLYPLFVEALGGKLSVGAPYFNSVFVPLMTPLVVALGIGALARWKADRAHRLWAALRPALIGAVVIGICVAAALPGSAALRTALGIALGAWIIGGTAITVYQRLSRRRDKAAAFARLPAGFMGMSLAHIGFAVTVVGIAVTSNYSSEVHRRMAPGDSIEHAGYVFTLERVRRTTGPNYEANEGIFQITRNGAEVTELHTQKRFYPVRGIAMTEAGIDPGLLRDVYVSLGEPLDGDAWSVRLYHKPFVRWLWLGALFMAAGGLMAAADRRYRSARRAASRVPQGAAVEHG